jgi:hypothetical protein
MLTNPDASRIVQFRLTLLDLVEALRVRPLKSDSITAASIYHAADREHPTLVIDEGGNRSRWRAIGGFAASRRRPPA